MSVINSNRITYNSTADTFTYTVTDYDECVMVTDALGGISQQVCDAGTTITYPKTLTFASGCVDTTNTSAFDSSVSPHPTPLTGSASKTVRVCGVTKTGGLTIGFWQNNNGQAVRTHGT